MIAVIIPCFNEAKRLPTAEILKFLSTESGYHFWFINDGSSDETLEVLKKIQNESAHSIFVLDLEKNSGKGEAVRQGVLKAITHQPYDYIGFWDADLATPLFELSRFSQIIKESGTLQFIVGCRFLHLGARIKRETFRHYLGRIFATAVSLMLKLPVYDTQCGAKLFKRELATKIFDESFISKWFFDVELFFRAKELIPFQAFLEIPLKEWTDVAGSKLKLKNFLTTPLELFKIFRHYKK